MSVSKSKSLGRGLGELLGEMKEAYDNDVPKNESVVEIPVGKIRPNPFQPRKHFDEKALGELASSIKTHGLIQPIVVIEDYDEYILVAGERRWRASKLAKLKTIRAVVAKLDDTKIRQHALIENIQREDLNIIETAEAFDELIKVHELTHDALAGVVHKSRAYVTNTLRLLTLTKKVKKALLEEKVSAGHAKMLVGLQDSDQKMVVDSIIGQRLSVRETEQLVKSMKQPEKKVSERKVSKSLPGMDALADLLKEEGFACHIGGQKLTITFSDDQNVEKFIKKLA